MPSFESQSSSTSGSGSHSASLSLSTSCSSSHSDSADTRDASDYERAEVVEDDDDDDDDDDTLKLKNPSATRATGAPRTYAHSVGFPRYEDLFYRPPPRTSSRAYLGLGLGLRRRNRDARVLVPPPASHIHKHGCDCDFDGGYGYEYGKNDDGYDYAYARRDPRASPGVDEQLRELMYEMRDWVVENPEEAYKRLQVCLRVSCLRVFVSSCFPALIFSFLFSA